VQGLRTDPPGAQGQGENLHHLPQVRQKDGAQNLTFLQPADTADTGGFGSLFVFLIL